MSRIAKNPVTLPSGVEIRIDNNEIIIKGKQGEIKQKFRPNLVNILIDNNEIKFEPKVVSRASDALSGTLRSLVFNMIIGVTEGFKKKLQLVGVGYRAKAEGMLVNLSLGFSHPVVYQVPDGITVETPTQTEIIISGFDKQKVGQVAAEIRRYRPPEPYKGKGVRYADEQVIIKATTKK